MTSAAGTSAPGPGPAPGVAQPESPNRRVGAVELAVVLGLPKPTAEQVRVVEAPLRPTVVVAGAGSGKTETMAARVVWLVANGLVEPDQVLGLTFTRKAAGELAERVDRRLRALRRAGRVTAGMSGPPTIATYNSFAAGLVRDHGLRAGVEPSTRLLGEAASWQLAYDLVERWNPDRRVLFGSDSVDQNLVAEDLAGLNRALDTIVQAVLSLAGQCAEHLADPREIGTICSQVERHILAIGGEPAPSSVAGRVLGVLRARRALVPVVVAFQRRKTELEAMDFGDQVGIAARLAEVSEVAEAQRRQYRVVLLDEFQDTSHAQLELLARLFGRGHPVTAVGDPNQAIYGWRGASAGNLDAFRSRFGHPNRPATVLGLTTSWRNPRLALTVANVVAAPLRQASPVPVEPLTPAPGSAVGRVVVTWHDTAVAEAAWVAEQVAARWGDGRTAAVICRRRAQFPLVEEALRAVGLPVEVVGIGGLLQRPEIADIVATLQVIADPTRSDALVRLLTGPRWQLGPRDLVALGAWARQLAGDEPDQATLVDAVDLPPPADWVAPSGHHLSGSARARLARLADQLARLRRRAGLPLVDLVGEVERALLLEIETAVAGRAASARAQLDAFAEVAADFSDATGRPTLPAFLSWLAAAAERERGLEQGDEEPERPRDGIADQATPDAGAVQVLTVHAAKGLEWDVVAVPGLVEDRFPAGRRSTNPDGPGKVDTASGWPTTLGDLPYPLRGDAASMPAWHYRPAQTAKAFTRALEDFKRDCGRHEGAEERRLAYVAVTRTRADLLLSGFVWDRDVKKPREPSRFLREVTELAEGPRDQVAVGDGAVEAVTTAVLDQVPYSSNPLLDSPAVHPWPDPGTDRWLAAAQAVRSAAARLATESGQPPGTAPPDAAAADGDDTVPAEPLEELSADVDRLLAERARQRSPVRDVTLPRHLSASTAVQLAGDPGALAAHLRRPMPVRPRESTRRGTAFHEWIERRLRSQALVDIDDLFGAADDDLVADRNLEALYQAFESSVWASREVVATEVDVETVIEGTVVRGRIDAVFAAPAADHPVRFDVVDWKTGPRPTGRDARAAALQLAVYRVAWARLRGLPVDQVRATFCYLASSENVTAATDLGEAEIAAAIRAQPLADEPAPE